MNIPSPNDWDFISILVLPDMNLILFLMDLSKVKKEFRENWVLDGHFDGVS